MPKVTVEKITEERGIPPAWLDKLLEFSEQVRHKAFELFEESGHPHKGEVNHWLEAEKQMPTVPRYELLETADHIDVCIAVPGFEAEEIGIVALADSLLVRAESGPSHEKLEGEVRYAEFNDHILFRRITLPKPIDVNRVSAKLDKGILLIDAPKAHEGTEGECQICRVKRGVNAC